MIHKLYTLTSLLIAHAIHTCAYVTPRSKKIWVCIGWHKGADREIFADNAKYFFLYLQNEKKHLTSVWLAKDRDLACVLKQKGYAAYYMYSFWGIYYALRAGYTITDARLQIQNWQFSSRSVLVQLWHGKGMKKSGHIGSYNQDQSRFVNPGWFLIYDFIVATSQTTAHLLSQAFNQAMRYVHVTGQPRTDVFYKKIPGSEIDINTVAQESITKAKQRGVEKIVLYAPTFRADGSNPLDQLDLEKLNTTLEEHAYHLLIGLHPKFATKTIQNIEKYSSISLIPSGLDLYPLFCEIDLLITDYSNIYMESLLYDIPLIFFTYDEQYYRQSTGLVDDFEALTPGPHVTSFSALLKALVDADTFASNRKRVRDILFTHQDGQSSERIFDELQKI